MPSRQMALGELVTYSGFIVFMSFFQSGKQHKGSATVEFGLADLGGSALAEMLYLVEKVVASKQQGHHPLKSRFVCHGEAADQETVRIHVVCRGSGAFSSSAPSRSRHHFASTLPSYTTRKKLIGLSSSLA